MTIKRSHFPCNERTRCSSEQSETYHGKKTFIHYWVFMIPIPIININILASVRQHRTVKVSWSDRMTITFATQSDIIIYALEIILSFAGENLYLFVANCACWIAEVIGLDSGVTFHIDNLETRRHLEQRETSTIPRDNATSAKCLLVTGSLQECLRGCGVQS
jgi:hypothetical protein